MKASQLAVEIIKEFESCRLKAYKDSKGIDTIGWGATMYKTGFKVKPGETVTQQQADELLIWQIGLKQVAVDAMTGKYNLNQNQFDALISLVYNIGVGAFAASTLLKKIKADKNDPAIALEFARWNKITKNDKMVEVAGLTRRRAAEALIYFREVTENVK